MGARGSLWGLGTSRFYSECDGNYGWIPSGEGGVMRIEVVTLTTRVVMESPRGWLC